MFKLSAALLTLCLLVAPVSAQASPGTVAPALPSWQLLLSGRSWIAEMVATDDVLYAAGSTHDGTTHVQVTAVDVATGDQLWQFASSRESFFDGLEVSPDGSKVAIVGSVRRGDGRMGIAVWTLNASDGSPLWSFSFRGDGAGHRHNSMLDAVFSPNSQRLYTTGYTWFEARRRDQMTFGFQASTGRVLFKHVFDGGRVRRSSRTAGISDAGESIGIAPDGRTVIVGGYTGWKAGVYDSVAMLTAFDARTGSAVWRRTYDLDQRANKMHMIVDVSVRNGFTIVSGATDWYRTTVRNFAFRVRNRDGAKAWGSTGPIGDSTGTYLSSAQLQGNLLQAGVGITEEHHPVIWSTDPATGDTAWSWQGDLTGQARSVVGTAGSPVYGVGSTGPESGLLMVGLDADDGAMVWRGVVDRAPASGTAGAITADGSWVFAAATTADSALIAGYQPSLVQELGGLTD